MGKDLKNKDRSKKDQMQSEPSNYDKEEKKRRNRDENSDSNGHDYKNRKEAKNRNKSRKESNPDSDSGENCKATFKSGKQGNHAKENSGSKQRDVKNDNSKSRLKYVEEEKVGDSSSSDQNTSKSREKTIKNRKSLISQESDIRRSSNDKDQLSSRSKKHENKNKRRDSNENSDEEFKETNIGDQDSCVSAWKMKTGGRYQIDDVNNQSIFEESTKNTCNTNSRIRTIKSGSLENHKQSAAHPSRRIIKLPKFSIRKPKKNKHKNSSPDSDSESPFRIPTWNMAETERVSTASKNSRKPTKKKRNNKDDSEEEKITTQNKKKRYRDGWYPTDIPSEFRETFRKTVLFTKLLDLQKFEDCNMQLVNAAFQIEIDENNGLREK